MVPYELKLAPLPCWHAEPAAAIRKKVAAMVAEIEAKAALRREALGIEPLGMERVRRQNPLNRPLRRKRSPKPLCHALSQP